MNAVTLVLSGLSTASDTMSRSRLWRAYRTEAKYETIRALRSPAFAVPFLLLPIALYIFIGVFLVGSMSHGDSRTATTMFVNFAVFGVMGPAMFGFGVMVANEREQGLLKLKRALPMPPAASLLAKMFMAVIFAALVMTSLVIAGIFIAHLQLSAGQFLGIALIDVAGALPFSAIGLFIGTVASGKSAPAFVNLAYLPMMYLGGLFFPLPRSVQSVEFASPAFYLQKLGLAAARTPSLDQLAIGATGPSSHGSPILSVAVLAVITLLFTALAVRRLARVG
jgi:ABC-2 type transport system permease protein